MCERASEVETTLSLLGTRVADQLVADGWRRLELDGRRIVTLTKPTPGGSMAVVELDRASFRLPDGWPTEIAATAGVGFAPALDLMAWLTLPPRAILIHGRTAPLAVEVTGPDRLRGPWRSPTASAGLKVA